MTATRLQEGCRAGTSKPVSSCACRATSYTPDAFVAKPVSIAALRASGPSFRLAGGRLTFGGRLVVVCRRALRTRWSQAEADAQMVGIECDVHLYCAGPGRHLAGDLDTGERAEEWSEVVADDLRRWPPEGIGTRP